MSNVAFKFKVCCKGTWARLIWGTILLLLLGRWVLVFWYFMWSSQTITLLIQKWTNNLHFQSLSFSDFRKAMHYNYFSDHSMQLNKPAKSQFVGLREGWTNSVRLLTLCQHQQLYGAWMDVVDSKFLKPTSWQGRWSKTPEMMKLIYKWILNLY